MSITQTLTTPTTAPSRTQDKDTFNTNVDNRLAWQATNVSELTIWQSQANALAAQMEFVASGAANAIPYTFSTTTADADPGAGYLRLDNATQNLATTIRVDLVGSDGSTWTDMLATWDDSTSTIKGQLMLVKVGDGTKWIVFNLTALATPSGYRNLTVAVVASSAASPFAADDDLLLKFTRTGDKGETGAAGGNYVLGTPVAATSGTSIDFTGLPSGCNRITVMFSSVSTNGTSQYMIQIGDSGGIETTGYLGSSTRLSNASPIATSSYTTGYGIPTNSSTRIFHGSVSLIKENNSTNTWIADGSGSYSDSPDTYVISGVKSLSAEIDRVRITTVGGTDTFDAGEVNIAYEY